MTDIASTKLLAQWYAETQSLFTLAQDSLKRIARLQDDIVETLEACDPRTEQIGDILADAIIDTKYLIGHLDDANSTILGNWESQLPEPKKIGVEK